jgi:hypothetical protein
MVAAVARVLMSFLSCIALISPSDVLQVRR